MNTYYFLTSVNVGPGLNAGSRLISDGIKALVKRADPDAILQDLTLFNYDKQSWSAIQDTAKGIFLCGNPRFDMSETPAFWLTDLLDIMLVAQKRGIKIGDLFLGAALPLPYGSTQTAVKTLMCFKRNQATLDKLSKFDLVITRDKIAQEMCEQKFITSVLLADSTLYAKEYLHVDPKQKIYNCVTIPSLNCSESLIKKLYKIKEQMGQTKQTYFLCHARNEYLLAKSVIKDIRDLIIIYDPRALLKFYAQVDKLVSCRLHGSIPALSLGAKVVNIAMDSRALSYDNFGCASIDYTTLDTEIRNLQFDKRNSLGEVSAAVFIKLFQEKIMR